LILAAEPSAQFAKANQEYAAGDFKAAIDDYEELVRSGQDTPNLFTIWATLIFEKPILAAPSLTTNARSHSIHIIPRPRPICGSRVMKLARSNWFRTDGNAFSRSPMKTNTLSLLRPRFGSEFSRRGVGFGRGRGRGAVALSILSLSIFAIAAGASYELGRGKNGRGLAIVTGDKVEARLATADNANRVLTLPAGSEIKIASQRGIGFTRSYRTTCAGGSRQLVQSKCGSRF